MVLRLAVLTLAALHLVTGQFIVPQEPETSNVLTPPYFNIATGKRIDSTATCGEGGSQVFCKLTGGPNEYEYNDNLYQGQFCDVCDVNDPTKSHPIKYAIDGTEKWWQSPPLSQGGEYNRINITIHLGQVFHVAYAIIKFANSPRAGTWVLERSSDHGKTFQPWQYFANSDSDCHNLFGIDAFEEITSDDSVICTSEYSDVVPLERGEVIVSMINHRPGAKNFSHSPVLQEWSKATDVRLRLLRTKTLLGHLMAVQRQDPTVTRRYFYSIKDISIGGRCVCNGHADTCLPDPDDRYKLKCQCRHNTCGDSCDMCCPKFVQKEWRPAVPENANECEACNCHGHTDECVYNEDVAIRRQSLDLAGEYEGGGVCQNCKHHTAGINCEKCIDGYYRPANVDPTDVDGCRPFPDWLTFYGPLLRAGFDIYVPTSTLAPTGFTPVLTPEFDNGLDEASGGDSPPLSPDSVASEGSATDWWIDGGGLPQHPDTQRPNWPLPGRVHFPHLACDCDSAFTVGTCEPVTGRCYCKPKYAGDRCDSCAPGYHKFPECEPCPCFYNATRDGVCLPIDGVCPCKYNFAGKYCGECALGFHNFPECAPCHCLGQGAMSDICDPYSGQCECDEGFGGLYCDQCSPGYYNYPVCQSCSCYNAFTTAQVCDPETGRCFCTELVTGESCNQCLPGYFDFPQCKECECSSPGSASPLCDAESGRCQCKPNYQGPKCNECAPEYYDFPNCIPCDCDVQGSQRTTCEAETGQCTCFNYIGGRRCDRCAPDYFNFPRCEDCKCDPRGIKSIVPGVCLAFTTGQCDCKENVVGKYCNMCSPLHYNLTLGCIDCNCFLQGTLDGVAACDTEEGQCWCKPYTCTQRCSQCEDGFYGLEESNYLGCTGCQCDTGGAMTADCDSIDGQCQCRDGVTGRKCDRVAAGHYYPTLLQHRFEIEDGSPGENEILRFGFSPEKFPSFSMKGYGEFSAVQPKVVLDVTITSNSLYKVLLYYVNFHPTTLSATLSFVPQTNPAGPEETASNSNGTDAESLCPKCSEQKFKVVFEPSAVPALLKVKDVFVLNRGKWNVVIEGEPGLLIDYLVLLPSQYYEPGILQAKVTEPCKPTLTPMGKECLMYTHMSLEGTSQELLTDFADKEQQDAPTTAHPEMVLLDGSSVNEDYRGMTVTLKPETAGKYVLVLTYASMEDRMQTIEASVSDGAGRTFSDVKFNAYACGYSFLCRQVALTSLSDVMVFDVSVPNIRVDLSVDTGEKVYVRGLHAIPYEDWNMEYVEPKTLCIAKEGPEFDECISWAYPIPFTARKFEAGGGGPVPTATDQDVDAVIVGDGNNTIQINMDLQPGRYVFLLHYFNPYHLSFSPSVIISGGLTHEGGANVTHCPHGDGCRAVVTSNTGAVVLDITNPTQTITITSPEGKSFWLDYVLAIPEHAYNADHLELMPIDHSRKFFEECYGVASDSLIDSAENPSEFCRSSVFSLTMDFNDGALRCECTGAGTVGGAEVDCEEYGGQCPCKPHVIGRQCDRCMIGYYGYPDCQPCDCDGALCDDVNGNCICPPNTMPSCDQCMPFTHSFHPLAGCESCDCNEEGVEDADDLGCSKEDGQCRCKENVEGHRCDKCKPGFFGFPKCRPCVCDQRGRISEGCDSVSGQCLCKENVDGQQCDRCKAGSFYLDGNNPLGCTKCFCFGASLECHSTQYPLKEIYQMDEWRLLNLINDEPEIRFDGNSATVDIAENGGPRDRSRPNLYWAAPKAYLGDKIGSYGGVLHYITYSSGRRGDSSSGGFVSSAGDQPAPISAPVPDVILEGNGMVISWVNRDYQGDPSEVFLNLTETNFVHKSTGHPVKREEMMMVLSPLGSIRIHASNDPDASSVTISGVSMTTTDYNSSLGSGPSIPSVEECACPKGYTGQSCQLCDRGHYREERGPYLGYCAECDCYGHCDTCDRAGQLVEFDDCLHNTAGPNCAKCKDGYIGDATSRDPDACQPCPCPYPSEDGNFAKSCAYDDEGDVICYCIEGYAGEKCDQCSSGYFGSPTVIGGECQLCNCHGNLDFNLLMETCDPVTGECSDCQFNTGGKYCERCADGYYGDAIIARNCTRCPCLECGTLQCDHMYGNCACKPHVIGARCDRCEPGYYNLQSCIGCQDCSCGIGARDTVCDEYSGQCECAPNVVGLKCDRCAPGHWDYSDMGCKPCNCRNNGDCNPVNGACKCPPGITGPQCDQCKLDRHILPPGGLQCESCDSCTHDLLDTIEPMTEKVQSSADELSKVSVGVAAANKLNQFQQQMEDAQAALHEVEKNMDGMVDDSEKLLNAGISGIEAAISGSGADIVTEMCNHTEALLEMIEKTSARVMRLEGNATDVVEDVKEFEVDSQDLLEKIPSMFEMLGEGSADKLQDESSGDTDEYLQKLNEAEMLLQRMKDRVFAPLQKIADEENVEAHLLLGLVSGNFTIPAEHIKERVGNVSEDLADKLNKMKELRTLVNEAIKKVNEVRTLNLANSKAITTAKEAIDRIKAEWDEINQIIKDAESLLDRSGEDPLTVLSTDLLLAAMDELKPVYDSYVDGLVGIEELVNRSLEKANMLKNDADMLSKLVDETKNDPRNVRAVEAANRYQKIINTMEKARDAAEQADLDATEAKNDVEEKNLGEAADKANTDAGQLLAEVENLLNKDVANLRNDLSSAKMSSNDMSELAKTLSDRLGEVNNGIDNLEHGDIDADVQKTKDDAAEANRLSEEAIEEANRLQEQIDNAPDPDVPLVDELAAVQDILGALPDMANDVKQQVQTLKDRAADLASLPNDLGLQDKINKIRKKIALSRSRAEGVSLSMQFKRESVEIAPEYVQVRVPPHVFHIEDFLRIEMFVNTSQSPDNSLLYLGDASSATGDYVALETVGGNVRYYYKVGEGVGVLQSEAKINDNQWHRVVIERMANKGKLVVEYTKKRQAGDRIGESNTVAEIKEGTTGGGAIKSTLPTATTPFVIGGFPLSPMPEKIQNRQLSGCIEGVKLNNESIGLWNFVSYNGPKPGHSCSGRSGSGPLSSSQMWRFRGYDSYVRVSADQLDQQKFYVEQNEVSFVFKFKFITLQSDSLLFFTGQSVDQFFALELRGGKFVVTCNFGFADGIKQKTLEEYPDVTTIAQPLSIKAGVVSLGRRNVKMIVLSINSDLNLNITFTEWNPDIRGDAWVGGLYADDLKAEFLPFVTNIDKHFRGCLTDLAFHIRATFSIYDAIERVGVNPGCRREAINNIAFDGDDFIAVASGLPNVETMSGFATVRTSAPDGTILSTVEPETGDHLTLFMRNGHIVLSDGGREIESRDMHNDGRTHSIGFERKVDGTLILNVDDEDKRTLNAVRFLTEDAKRRRKRRTRRRRPKQRFMEAAVHVYIGGARNEPKFVGCIGNIQIENDPWHPGVLTEGARCGFFGNVKCVGNPLFNVCSTGTSQSYIIASLGSVGTANPITNARVVNGEVSAVAFTDGVSELDNYNETLVMSEAGDTPRRRKGRRGRNKQKKFGIRDEDRVLGIDAVHSFGMGYDENCRLPLSPETRGFYYPGDGYSKYSVDEFNSLNWRFKVRMRTEAKEGIIFFMCTTSCPEHIAVYLVKGRITLSVKFGTERRRLKSPNKYNDGLWHDVTFQRKSHKLQMIIDTIILDSDFFENSYTFSPLMLFYIGGLQVVEKRAASVFMSAMHLNDFTGCIQGLQVNDQPLEMSTNTGLLFKINLRPCFEGETEPGIFFSNTNPGEDGAYMLVHNTYDVGINLEVTMEIRPRTQSGVLLAVGGFTGNFFQLVLIDGKVVARVKQETDVLMLVYDPRSYDHALCDGNWHKVKAIKAKNILALTVDGNQVSPIEQGNVEIQSCDTDGPLYIGGLPRNARVGKLLAERTQYIGCMRKVRLDYFNISPALAIEVKSGVSESSCPLY